MSWIEEHETDRKNATKIKAESVDGILGYQRGGSTLYVHGCYVHIKESADVIEQMIELANQETA